jgi:hypothetical protein
VNWQKDWGSSEQKLQDLYDNTGFLAPALAKKPVLSSTCTEILSAYRILDRHRSVGFDRNPIQLSEIVAFYQLYGLPSMGHEMFEELIAMVDYEDRSREAVK